MTDTIVYPHGARPREVPVVTRIGFFEHRQCEHLLRANERPPEREGPPDFAPEARLRSAAPGRRHTTRSSRP